jgi:hypothetical protein
VVIAESWHEEIQLGEPRFVERIERTGKRFGKAGAKAGAAAGCVTGAIALTAVAPAQGAPKVGCVAGGAVMFVPSYIVGYGLGTIAGALEGATYAAAGAVRSPDGDRQDSIDATAASVAFKEANPSVALTRALDDIAEEHIHSTDFNFVTGNFVVEDKPLSFLDQVPKRIKFTDADALRMGDGGNSHILLLLIHRFNVTTTGTVTPESRLSVHLTGELRTRANQKIGNWKWNYQSGPIKPQELVANKAAALRNEITRAWHFLAGEIFADFREAQTIPVGKAWSFGAKVQRPGSDPKPKEPGTKENSAEEPILDECSALRAGANWNQCE